mgnify:CR=1 FL=1
MDAQRLQWIFGMFPAVEKFWNHPAGKLSGGQKQMVAVARAIVEPRDLLIVDEPSKGLAPAIVHNMIEAFAQLKASGVSNTNAVNPTQMNGRLTTSATISSHSNPMSNPQ